MGKKVAIGLIIIIGVAGGIAGWYFFLRPEKEDYSGLLLLQFLIPELPTPPVKVDNSIVGDLRHGVGIFVGDYSLKNIFYPTVPTFPDFEILLLGKFEVKNTTVVTNPIFIDGNFSYINLFEDATLKMTNVSYPNLEINCFGSSKLLIDNCTIGSIYARDSSRVTVKNSTVSYIYDMDPIFSALYEVLDVDAEAIDSKIKILNGSNIGAVIITAGADAEIDSSFLGFMQAASSDSAKPAVINITNSFIGTNLILGASTDATINTLSILSPTGEVRLEGDAIATITSLNVHNLLVVQAAYCKLNPSIINGGLLYGIVCVNAITTVTNFTASAGGPFDYQNNTRIVGFSIPEAKKQLVSVLVAAAATAVIENCTAVVLDSVMAVNFGTVKMKNVIANFTIAKDFSVFNITLSTLTTLILYENSQVQINQSSVQGTKVGVSAGMVALMFPVGIRTSDNSILYMTTVTAYALTGGDSSQLYMDNIIITLIIDIETIGTVRLTNFNGPNTIVALEVGMGTQGSPVGDVLIQGATIYQASVKGSARVNFTQCIFAGVLLGGIIVSAGTAVIVSGIQIAGPDLNYTTIKNCQFTIAKSVQHVLGNIEVNNSGTVNITDYLWIPVQINISIDMYHNSIANLQNATLGLVFMMNSSKAYMHGCNLTLPFTALTALVVTHNAMVQIDQNSYVGLLLLGREDEQAAYSATLSASTIVIGYVIGYAKVKFELGCIIQLYVECAGGADTGKYALELLSGTQASQVNARSWAPLA
ncbi:MAG: hypothetical protein ACFFDN_23655 [Candidatus Hodarchaeota archaeon]